MKKLRITKTRNDRYVIESYIDDRLIKTIYVSKHEMIKLRRCGLPCELGNMAK